MSAKHTPTFLTGWEVSREKESGNEFFQITAPIYDDKVGPVLDTMNCHHCLTTEDEEKIARLASAAPALVECLRLTLFDLDREDFKSESDRLIYIEKNIRAAQSSAGVTP
jgi:hypothetical protein